MKRLLAIPTVVILCSAGSLIAGCGEETAPPPPPKPVATAPAPAAAAAPVEVTTGTVTVPEYTYDTTLRNPFRPATQGPEVPTATDCGPLCEYELGRFKITGIIWGISEPVAMLQGPDGKAYIAKVGMPIGQNNGKIVSITQDRLVVLEKYVNYRGEVVTNRVDVALAQEGARR